MIVLVLIAGCNGTAPIINSFSANPSTITVGESSTLSWSVTDATSVTIDNGIGSVALTGTTTVTPATTTTYTLTATNTAGSVTGSVTVTVGAAYGSIDINSTPTGAKVYLDGVDTGQVTPIILTSVTAGAHTIKLDLYLYEHWESLVTVVAGQTIYLNPPLTHASPETTTLQPGSEGKDAGVETFSPDANWEILYYFGIGNSTAPNTVRAYIQFDLSTIPEGIVVTDADLKLYHYSSWGSAAFTIGLYKVTGSWLENSITWNNQPTSSSDAEFLRSIPAGSINYWRSWDIDTLVQGWLDGTITNYGMLLMDTDETLVQTAALFYTSDYTADTSKHPKLEIDYYDPTP
ncbi:unnamed protein product [marine sediment metagenome]|uniref:Uncharacterized protein n=1 Tax=marine sediment metagenome TaxID=412755 RepID=X0ZSK7_9ZZZZ